jgi:hypothetical protein
VTAVGQTSASRPISKAFLKYAPKGLLEIPQEVTYIFDSVLGEDKVFDHMDCEKMFDSYVKQILAKFQESGNYGSDLKKVKRFDGFLRTGFGWRIGFGV